MASASLKTKQGRRGYLAFLWFVDSALLAFAAIVFHQPWLFVAAAVFLVMFFVRLGSYLNAIDEAKRARDGQRE